MDEGEAIESKLVTRAIENAQRKVEAHNFDIRKHLLEFDDVANDQRKVIYEKRNDLLDGESVLEEINDMLKALGFVSSSQLKRLVAPMPDFLIPTGFLKSAPE